MGRLLTTNRPPSPPFSPLHFGSPFCSSSVLCFHSSRGRKSRVEREGDQNRLPRLCPSVRPFVRPFQVGDNSAFPFPSVLYSCLLWTSLEMGKEGREVPSPLPGGGGGRRVNSWKGRRGGRKNQELEAKRKGERRRGGMIGGRL